ncbi:MAG: hypothetical protein RIE06_33725 [Roseibium album]|uniref:hypothetical protein n=1 Tax=Roseibium album TaxID=311410 RepID=UPI0032EE22D5
MPCVDTLKAMICCPFVVFGLNPQNDRGNGCFLGRAVRREQSSQSNSEDLSKHELVTVYEDKGSATAGDGAPENKPRGFYGVTSPLLAVAESKILDDAAAKSTQGPEKSGSVDSDVAMLDALVAAGTTNKLSGNPDDASENPVVSTKSNTHDAGKSYDLGSEWARNSKEAENPNLTANTSEREDARGAMPSVLFSAKYSKNGAGVTKDTEDDAQVGSDPELISELDI